MTAMRQRDMHSARTDGRRRYPLVNIPAEISSKGASGMSKTAHSRSKIAQIWGISARLPLKAAFAAFCAIDFQ